MIPTQRTEEARAALAAAVAANEWLAIPAHVAIEFTTIVLGLERRKRLTCSERERVIDIFARLRASVEFSPDDWNNAVRIALLIGMPETFDTGGFAVAQRLGAEFWTCDRRFANAAHAAGLSGYRLFG